MESREQSLLIPALVYVGAVVLIGLPATALVSSGFGELAVALGFERVLTDSIGEFALWLVSLLVGLQLAVEAAAVQLGGLEALGRGTRRMALLRSALLTLAVWCALAGATWIGISIVFAGFGPSAAVLGALVGLAGLAVLYRSTSAFYAGYHGSGH